MVTIKDVAQQASVSISTVSRVINRSAPVIEIKRDAVHKAMTTLNYQPNRHAQALVRKYSNTVGLMVDDISIPWFNQLVQSVGVITEKENKGLFISCGDFQQRKSAAAIRQLLCSGCDALIIYSSTLSDMELVSLLQDQPTVVLLNRRISVLAEQCISIDYFQAGLEAAHYLIELGHRSIAYLNSSEGLYDSSLKQEGYNTALQNRGLSNISHHLIKNGFPTVEGGYTAMRQLLNEHSEVSAVLAYNDAMASGALKAIKEAGLRVPQNISLIGFDDNAITNHSSPTLTTMRYPIETMAKSAAQLALSLVDGKNYTTLDKPEKLQFQARLIIRESVISCYSQEQ